MTAANISRPFGAGSQQPHSAQAAAVGDVSAEALRQLISTRDEIAVVDARETFVHARDGHILLSVSLPLSQLELKSAALLPRRTVRIVVYDSGTGNLAARAAQRLVELGYRNVSVLNGGTAAWKAAGYSLFTGVNVVGKAFGEFVEHVQGTPHLSVQDVKARLDAGDNVVVIDSRTEPEFRNFSIPGAINTPGAEIVYRFYQAVPDPETLVVVNCAGRTRSIIGAQALINAGVPNKVVALENGTMDWLIAGFTLDSQKSNLPAKPSGDALARAKASAAKLIEEYAIPSIDLTTLEEFRSDNDKELRSLYVLDVRSLGEYEAGHVPGSNWAQGGQLVQQSGEWVGTRNGRIVLVDNADGVRAAITASWLIQLNIGDVYILKDAFEGKIETGAERRKLVAPAPSVPSVHAETVSYLLEGRKAVLIDVDSSVAYEAGHVPGAHFAIRSRLSENADALPGEGAIILASGDGVLAAFAANDLAKFTGRPVSILTGGTAAWRDAGLPLERGTNRFIHPPEDVARNAYQAKPAERFDAFREYLDWEKSLVAQLDRDGTTAFRTFPEQSAPAAVEAAE